MDAYTLKVTGLNLGRTEICRLSIFFPLCSFVFFEMIKAYLFIYLFNTLFLDT